MLNESTDPLFITFLKEQRETPQTHKHNEPGDEKIGLNNAL